MNRVRSIRRVPAGHGEAILTRVTARYSPELDPDIVLTAMDSDVIQQYVSLELGVGIVAAMASEHTRQNGLQTLEVAHLFAPNVTRLAVRRGAYLRSYTVDFILQFAPQLKRADIVAALHAETP